MSVPVSWGPTLRGVRRVGAVLLILAASAAAEDRFWTKVGVLDEFPRAVARGRSLTLRGMVKGGYKDPELLVIGADGHCYKVWPEDITEFRFHYIVRFEHGVGRYRFEMIAKSNNRVRSLARFDVWHGTRKPADYVAPPLPDGPAIPLGLHPRLMESRVFDQINAMRKKLRLKPLAWNEAVAARAREHALRMAKAERRMHRFGNAGGVRDMLGNSGAGDDRSGSTIPWSGLTNRRPFDPPQPQAPSRNVRNHVLVFLHDDASIARMLEKAYGREAAHRICAVDPHATEIAVGAAWPSYKAWQKRKPDPKTGRKADFKAYFCVCFIQVNDKTILDRQKVAFSKLAREARRLHPDLLRRLSWWQRPKRSISLLRRARKNPDAAVAGAAFDGMLILDEERARADLKTLGERTRELVARGRYADAVAPWSKFVRVTYDRRIPNTSAAFRAEAEAAAHKELAAAPVEPEARKKALESLARRTKGMKVHESVEDALAKID